LKQYELGRLFGKFTKLALNDANENELLYLKKRKEKKIVIQVSYFIH